MSICPDARSALSWVEVSDCSDSSRRCFGRQSGFPRIRQCALWHEKSGEQSGSVTTLSPMLDSELAPSFSVALARSTLDTSASALSRMSVAGA